MAEVEKQDEGIQSAAPSERRFLAAEAIAIFEDPGFTARGRAAIVLQRIQAMEIAPQHEAHVAALVRDFVVMLKEVGARSHLGSYLSDDVIARETEKLSNAIRFGGYLLHGVVPVDEVTRCFPELIRFYSGAEIDIIRGLCRGTTKIADGFDAAHITIGDRTYSRYELREAGRPQSFTNIERWHSQFPPLPTTA